MIEKKITEKQRGYLRLAYETANRETLSRTWWPFLN